MCIQQSSEHRLSGLKWLCMQINDRYEFPDQLDLDVEDGKFLSPDADRNVRNLYKLHSVLVHSGGVHGGHYFAYIRPSGKQWLRYDDERVSQPSANSCMFIIFSYIAEYAE